MNFSCHFWNRRWVLTSNILFRGSHLEVQLRCCEENMQPINSNTPPKWIEREDVGDWGLSFDVYHAILAPAAAGADKSPIQIPPPPVRQQMTEHRPRPTTGDQNNNKDRRQRTHAEAETSAECTSGHNKRGHWTHAARWARPDKGAPNTRTPVRTRRIAAASSCCVEVIARSSIIIL